MHCRIGRTAFKLVILIFLLTFLVNVIPFASAKEWNTQIRLTDIGSLLFCYPAISGDGSKVVFQAWPEGGINNSTGFGIYTINSDGSGLNGPIAVGNLFGAKCITNDGSKIVYSANDDFSTSDICIVNSDGSGRHRGLNGLYGGLNAQPCISGDGRKVAWVHRGETSSYSDIMLTYVDDPSTAYSPTSGESNEVFPSMDNTGDKIAYQVLKDDNSAEVFVWSKDAGSTYLANGGFPSISGDGKKIAFTGIDGKIYMINSDGSGLTGPIATGVYPRISYDGAVVAFLNGDSSRDFKAYCVNSDGSNLKQISDAFDLEFSEPASISADGQTVVFAKHFGQYSTQEEIFLVNVDLKPPVTTDDYDGKLRTNAFQITLTASDDVSKVARICYKINGGSTNTVSEDGEPTITKESLNNTLEYWSVDNAGNEENHNFLFEIGIGSNPPLDLLPAYLVSIIVIVIVLAGIILKVKIFKGKTDMMTIGAIPKGWQFYEGLTSGEPPGYIYRTTEDGGKEKVVTLKPKIDPCAEAIGNCTQSGTMDTLVEFTGLKPVQAKAKLKESYDLTFEMPGLIREQTEDPNLDKLIEQFLNSGFQPRPAAKYFVIRQARKTKEINYQLTKKAFEDLGGNAELSEAKLKAKNLSFQKEKQIIQQKFDLEMRVMYKAEEIVFKKDKSGRYRVIHKKNLTSSLRNLLYTSGD